MREGGREHIGLRVNPTCCPHEGTQDQSFVIQIQHFMKAKLDIMGDVLEMILAIKRMP